MLQRRKFVLTAGASLLVPHSVRAHQLDYGDKGFHHKEYHDDYAQVFGKYCRCGEGECRATIWRRTQLQSPIGYDVVVDREWRPLPPNVYLPPSDKIPQALRNDPAHVCAYSGLYAGKEIVLIPCAIINVSGA